MEISSPKDLKTDDKHNIEHLLSKIGKKDELDLDVHNAYENHVIKNENVKTNTKPNMNKKYSLFNDNEKDSSVIFGSRKNRYDFNSENNHKIDESKKLASSELISIEDTKNSYSLPIKENVPDIFDNTNMHDDIINDKIFNDLGISNERIYESEEKQSIDKLRNDLKPNQNIGKS